MGAETLRAYAPGEVVVHWNGIIVTGSAEDIVESDYDEDRNSLEVGAGGEGMLVKSASKSGTIKITLMQSTATNDLLWAAHVLHDMGLPGGRGPLLIKDNSGRTVEESPEAWIQRPPPSKFAKTGQPREWVLRTNNLIRSVGGN